MSHEHFLSHSYKSLASLPFDSDSDMYREWLSSLVLASLIFSKQGIAHSFKSSNFHMGMFSLGRYPCMDALQLVDSAPSLGHVLFRALTSYFTALSVPYTYVNVIHILIACWSSHWWRRLPYKVESVILCTTQNVSAIFTQMYLILY